MSVAINAKIDYPRSIEIIEPDCLYSYGAPDDDFVMSRDCNNKVVSKYGDDVWDFWPYNTISSSPRRFIFSSLNAGKKDKNTIVLRKQIKSIAFAILYGATRIRSISSIFAYLNPLRSFANGLAELNTNFETATYSQKLKAISKICCKSKSYKDSVMGCTYMLINEIDPNLIGFDIFPANERSNLVNALLEIKPTSETKQTDIIPSRIYSELIVGVEQFINDVDVVLPKFCEFAGKINTVTGYGLAYDARIRKFKAIDIKPQLLDIKKRNGDVVKSWRYPYVPILAKVQKSMV